MATEKIVVQRRRRIQRADQGLNNEHLDAFINGRTTLKSRVNDRGPFVRGRVIDVSLSAARALGMMRSGVMLVSVQ